MGRQRGYGRCEDDAVILDVIGCYLSVCHSSPCSSVDVGTWRPMHRDGAQSGAQTGSGLTVLLETEGGRAELLNQ